MVSHIGLYHLSGRVKVDSNPGEVPDRQEGPHGFNAPRRDEGGSDASVLVFLDQVSYPDMGWGLSPGSTHSAATPHI